MAYSYRDFKKDEIVSVGEPSYLAKVLLAYESIFVLEPSADWTYTKYYQPSHYSKTGGYELALETHPWLPKRVEPEEPLSEPGCRCNSFDLTWYGHDTGCPEKKNGV